MSDLIDRQAAIEIVRECFRYGWYCEETVREMEKLPTIDAVQVVRCKDCKHYNNHDKRCKVWNHGVPEYGYCYEGVRKDDETG